MNPFNVRNSIFKVKQWFRTLKIVRSSSSQMIVVFFGEFFPTLAMKILEIDEKY